MIKDIMIFDLDGTLSLAGDRLKYLQRKPKDWDKFYERCGEDLPNESIVKICQVLYYSYKVMILTGRKESVRSITEKWLDDNEIPYCELLMRPDYDYREDSIVKPELLGHFGERVIAIFEDRDRMVTRWRELGYTCLQVQKGDY